MLNVFTSIQSNKINANFIVPSSIFHAHKLILTNLKKTSVNIPSRRPSLVEKIGILCLTFYVRIIHIMRIIEYWKSNKKCVFDMLLNMDF